MYIRKTRRKYKDKIFTNHLLVESVSTPKGPRQKVVCSLGDLSPRPREEWLKLAHKVESALVGQGAILDEADREVAEIVRKVKARRQKEGSVVTGADEISEEAGKEVVSVVTNKITTERHREAGAVHVGYQFWRRLGLDEILAQIGLDDKTRILTCAMTMNRLVHPGSELAMPDWIRKTALEDILEVNFERLAEDALYRNMDRLYPNRAAIESELAERERTLFNLDNTLLLYDLTSTYFEGLALKNPMAKRGYSRDKRPDCKQVIIGLVINRDGFPRAHEVMEGNKRDRETLAGMLGLLDERVGLKEGQTVVVDRGMAYEDNIEEIKSRKLHYIVASRQSERDEYLSDFEDSADFNEVVRKPSPLNAFQEKSQIKVKMKESGDELHVLCISRERVEKDRAIRQKKEQRLVVDLEKLKKRIESGKLVKPIKIGEAIGRLKERYPRVARYYDIEFDPKKTELKYAIDKEKMSKAEELDGSYLLKTDRKDLSAEEAWRTYMLLTRAENAFRSMKSPLAERPVFHQFQERVETHIFLCVLAYHLLVAIEKTLLDQGVHTSWGTVRQILDTHKVSTIVLPTDKGSVLRIRKGSTPEPQCAELYRLLSVPARVIAPVKNWSDSDTSG
jgi:transposase